MPIRLAGPDDADVIGRLVFELLEELAAPASSGYELASVVRTSRDLLEHRDRSWALLAETAGRPDGVLTLNECAAIYARGRFGEICELYVRPDARSRSIGERLIAAAAALAQERGWTRLEVTGPVGPKGARSVAFYKRLGFVDTGPHLKREPAL